MTIQELEIRSRELLLQLANNADYNVHFDPVAKGKTTYHGLYFDDNTGLDWYAPLFALPVLWIVMYLIGLAVPGRLRRPAGIKS